ncbi:VOC family protein [Rhodococcus rhodochrous]|uniref:VOC family protein n=1 Tax=Rhodococcus rhodochrous TaxID=1829 RepID=UPI00036C21B8|nr:VOC family protein [Rhodococcus rhodochrous]
MGRVRAFGYLVATVKDIEAWKVFAADVHGMQIVEHTEDRLKLRLDERAWRIDLHRGEVEHIDAVGWEVRGPEDIEALEKALIDHGYSTRRASAEEAAYRQVTDYLAFTDPDGHGIEVYYGQHRESTPFVSPTGARFVTEGMGIGHVMFAVSESAPFRELYMDILGLGLSDFIDIGPDPGTFLHCNPRHHSVAFAHRPGFGPRLGHLMVQVDNLDTVGRAYDRILEGAAPLGATLGKHTNDEMISYYVKTPSGWEMEYGYGGLEIDEDTWVPGRWNAAHFWGHQRVG